MLFVCLFVCSFIISHDTQRNGRAQLTYKNGTLYNFASLFMLAFPYGNVRLMSSYYFTNTDAGPPSVSVTNGKYCNDGQHWVCEHRWPQIAAMVAWRNAVGTSEIGNWQTGNGNQIAFSRGGKGFIAFNRGSSTWTVTLTTGLPAGNYVNILDSSGSHVIAVDSQGKASLQVPSLGAIAFHR